MTLEIQKPDKKGGPYSKAQQEQRRDKVYEMHFKLGYTAVQIAQDLGVNRNTISDDIKYLYSETVQHFGAKNIGKAILRQFERFEIQRREILEEIKRQNEFEKIFRLKKFLFDLDQRIAQIISKMIVSRRFRYCSLE